MNFDNVEDNRFVGRLLEGVRRSRDYTQMKVAKELGIPQGTLSKIESGQLELSAKLWHRFCSSMDISLDTLVKGYLDEGLRVPKPNTKQSDERRYRLRSNHNQNCYWNVRGVSPFIQYEMSVTKESAFSVNLNRKKVPGSYFMTFDNLVNLPLLMDATPSFKKEKNDFIDFFRENFNGYLFHGDLHLDYERSKNPLSALKKYIGHSNKYSCDYRKSIIKENGAQILLCYERQAPQTLETLVSGYNKLFLESICSYSTEILGNVEISHWEEKGREYFQVKVA